MNMHIKDYYRPDFLEEAVALLDMSPKKTKILAGGTDLIIQMQLKETKPEYLLDIGGIDSIKEIRIKDNCIFIGSMATFSQIENDNNVCQYIPILAQAAASIGSVQIRNRATIGGNIANAAPAADTIPALLALNSRIELQSVNGIRVINLNEILLGINQTSIKPTEILTKIIIPLPEQDTYQSFKKIGRRKAMAIARINLALVITYNPGQETIKEAKVALGAVGTTPYRVEIVENMLKGKVLDNDLIEQVSEQIEIVVLQRLGTRPTAPYKKTIAKAVLRQALTDIRTRRRHKVNEKNY